MILLLTLALFLNISMPTSLLKNTTQLGNVFQEKCLRTLPFSSSHGSTLASLICGEKLSDENLKSNLSRTSLIHIFIVSGSHLLLLDEFLGILRIPLFVRFMVLTVYSFLVGWQPPAVRALIAIALRLFLKNRSLYFPADLVVLMSGLLGLSLFPGWWQFLSFQMSWCAGLALSFTSLLRLRRSWQQAVLSQSAIFVFMSAPLWGLGSLHPLSMVYNLILAPVVAYALLPLSFATLLHPIFLRPFEFIMIYFESLLQVMAEPIQIVKGVMPSSTLLWLWIFGLHFGLHFLRLRMWQGRDSV